MNTQSFEAHEQTLALLEMLAMGNREIEQGRYRSAAEVFAALDHEE